MDDVAIIGVGLHPFGRFPGKSAFDMGAEAIRAALNDAGVHWDDIQVAFGGSIEASNTDAIVNRVGLSGVPFHNVSNGCATAATALSLTASAISHGQADLGIAVGMDKHQPGAFTGDPEEFSLPQWYAQSGYYLTTLFFAMKINRYMHEHDITPQTLAKVAAKNYRNGSINPNVFRRKPLTEDQILESPMLNYPLTQYMFCAPDEGAAAAILCRADRVREYTDTPIYLRASVVKTRRLGAFEVHSPSIPAKRVDGPTVDASRPRTRWPASGLTTSMSRRSRTRKPARRSCTWPRTASARTASRTCSSRPARPRSPDASRSTPTAASSPTASRSARRVCGR